MGKKASFFLIISVMIFCQSLSGLTWSPSLRLCWNPGDSRSPVVAVGTDDSIHVVWRDGTPGNLELYYRRSTDGGSSWSALKRLTWNSGISIQPTMAIDSGNVIHIVWSDDSAGNHELFHKKSTDGGNSWSSSKRLTWTPESTAQAQIEIDSSDTIHIICLDTPSVESEIYYKKSTDGGASWTSLKRLTWTGDFSSLPAFAIAPDDSLHVVWREDKSSNWEIYYKKSTNGGTTWSGSKRLTWTPTSTNVPDIAVDLNNNIVAVWKDNAPGTYELFYRYSSNGGNTWSPTKRLTWHPNFSEGPSLAVASNNVIHLAWYNYISSTNPEIFYKFSSDSGKSWSPTQRLTWNLSWSGYPMMATDSSNNVHMVWEEYITNNYDIFYRNGK